MFGSWIARISGADCQSPAAILLLPEPQAPALSPRRPVDRPPADLEHHDLPRRRQGPQQVVQGFGRKPDGPAEPVDGDACRAAPGDREHPGSGVMDFFGVAFKPFAEGGSGHELCMVSGGRSRSWFHPAGPFRAFAVSVLGDEKCFLRMPCRTRGIAGTARLPVPVRSAGSCLAGREFVLGTSSATALRRLIEHDDFGFG